MLSLIDICMFFMSKGQTTDIIRLENTLLNDGFITTNYANGDTLNNLLFCLIMTTENYSQIEKEELILNENDMYLRKYINTTNKIYQQIKTQLINFININIDNGLLSNTLNKKKLITLINLNQYNHEIVLILCAMYNINIFVFYKDIDLFKVYYDGDEFNTKINNIFIQYGTDVYSCNKRFDILYKTNKYTFGYNEIQHLINNNKTDIYPIGINENKILKINTDGSLPNNKYIYNILTPETVNYANSLFSSTHIDDIKWYNIIMSLTHPININTKQIMI